MPIKLKVLEGILQELGKFENPDIRLEQYATSAADAAQILNIICTNGDISGKLVADLGCGCGIFATGASLLDAGYCIGVDIDKSALEIAQLNVEEAECSNVDFVQADVLLEGFGSKWTKTFDTVILNPPFGTKGNKGTDMQFLKVALRLAKTSVYSLHKSSTRQYIEKTCRLWNVDVEPLYEIKFELPKSYKKHRHEMKYINVDLLHFSCKSTDIYIKDL